MRTLWEREEEQEKKMLLLAISYAYPGAKCLVGKVEWRNLFEFPIYCLPDGEEMSLAQSCREATEIVG